MWSLVLLAAAACPSMHLVSSSAGLAGVRADQVEPLAPETLDAWLAKRAPGCPKVTVWAEEGLDVLPAGLLSVAKRFPQEDPSIIRGDRYATLPESVRRLYPRSALNEPVAFVATELEQPRASMWTGPIEALFANAQTEVTPPYVTVRSSRIAWQDLGFEVSWSREKTWLAMGGWPLPIRFIDDGRAALPAAGKRAPRQPLIPGSLDEPRDMIPLPKEPPILVKRCTSLAIVAAPRGLTVIDGPQATPMEDEAGARKWLASLRARGCRLPLVYWHLEGTPPPMLSPAFGSVSFQTFPPGVQTQWGETELRTLPGPMMENAGVSPGEMVIRARVSVPMLSACADPGGPGWRPAPPLMARLELQELRVEAPYAVFSASRLRWAGLSGTSRRCAPQWEERDVVLRVPPTALPIRLVK